MGWLWPSESLNVTSSFPHTEIVERVRHLPALASSAAPRRWTEPGPGRSACRSEDTMSAEAPSSAAPGSCLLHTASGRERLLPQSFAFSCEIQIITLKTKTTVYYSGTPIPDCGQCVLVTSACPRWAQLMATELKKLLATKVSIHTLLTMTLPSWSWNHLWTSLVSIFTVRCVSVDQWGCFQADCLPLLCLMASDTVSPVCLPNTGVDLSTPGQAWITGWGDTRSSGNDVLITTS